MRRVVHVALALAAVLTVRVGVADPFAAAAEIRALACCRSHCKHAMNAAQAARCCEIRADRAEPALRSPSGDPTPAPIAVAGIVTGGAERTLPTTEPSRLPAVQSTGPPAFLVHRVLRL
jgi:hypothetical protein